MTIEWLMMSNHLIIIFPLFLLQSFQASGSFLLSQLFTSGGQSIGASALASVLPVNPQGWCPLGLTDWSPCSPRDLQESSLPQFKSINSSMLKLLYGPALMSVYMTTGKTIILTIGTFSSQVISVLFNVLFRFVIAFLPRSKCLSVSWLQSSSTLILESRKIKWKSLSRVWLFASPWTVWNSPG